MAGYGVPFIQLKGRSVGAASTPGLAARQAVRLALETLSRNIQENPGNVVTAEASYGEYKVTSMYAPGQSGYVDEDSTPPSGPQWAQGIYKLLEPSARWIFQRGYCALKADSDCTTGIMTYEVVKGQLPRRIELKKRSAPTFANSSFTTGIHYLPINGTVHAKIMPRPRLSNARVRCTKEMSIRPCRDVLR